MHEPPVSHLGVKSAGKEGGQGGRSGITVIRASLLTVDALLKPDRLDDRPRLRAPAPATLPDL